LVFFIGWSSRIADIVHGTWDFAVPGKSVAAQAAAAAALSCRLSWDSLADQKKAPAPGAGAMVI
jgi:hypothetical protein